MALVMTLSKIVVNELSGDVVLEDSNIVVKAMSVGEPFIFECGGLDDPFNEIRKNISDYLKIPFPLDAPLLHLGVVIGKEVEVYAYGAHHFYPAQFYKILED